MKVKFCDSHLKLSRNVCGVYKLVINETWFYIGSSVDLKRRLSAWKHYLSHKDKFKKNRSVLYLYPIMEFVRFEILELITDGSNPKLKEDEWIKKHFEDEHCLNLVPSATNSKGRKLPLGVIRREKKKLGDPTPKKPVAQFDLNGNLIARHESILAASKALKCKTDPITWILQGEQSNYKGFVFKRIDKDGTFIEPPKFIRKPKKYVFVPNKKTAKEFYQIDDMGIIVEKFHNIQTAADKMGCPRTSIWKVLEKKNKYRCKGYFWKYAKDVTISEFDPTVVTSKLR